MSWSISLSGKKSVVHSELRNAILEMQHALDTVQSTDSEKVTVNVSGYVSQGADGSVSSSNAHTVTGLAPVVADTPAASGPVAV